MANTAYDKSISVSSNTTLTRSNKLVMGSGGSSGITITLFPAANGDNLSVTVQKMDSAAGAVLVVGKGGVSISLSSEFDSAYFVFEGSEWAISSTSFGSGGGGGGTPGSPPLSVQGANAAGTAFVGIPNFTFDPILGDLTLDADLVVNGPLQVTAPFGADRQIEVVNHSANPIEFYTSTDAITYFESDGAGGFVFDATGAFENGTGTGPINFTSAGGASITDNSGNALILTENAANSAAILQVTDPSSFAQLQSALFGIQVGDGSGITFSCAAHGGPTFANLPTAPVLGSIALITDSNVSGFNDIITAGGGANVGLAVWTGSAWTFR